MPPFLKGLVFLTYVANAGTGTGLGAVSFLKNNGALDSQALGFSRDASVRSVFSVFKGSGFLLTDTQTYKLHRLSNENPSDSLLLKDHGQIDYLGTVRVNGNAGPPLADAMPTSLRNGFNLVSLIGNGAALELDSFNKDRTFHAGNQAHAETILFDTVIDDSRRQQIESYLARKWFGEGTGLGNLLPTTALSLSNGGTLDLSGVNFQTFASISSTDGAGSKILVGVAALTVGDSTSTTFDGTVSGFGRLQKQGNGTLTLTGSNNYTGTTTINAGTLEIGDAGKSGTLGSGNVIIASGAILENQSQQRLQHRVG